jgi:formylglycine-generating enzyme
MRSAALSALTALVCACAPPRQDVAQTACAPDLTIGSSVNIAAGYVARGEHRLEPEERHGGDGDVAAFSLDAHEVTNAQYARFVESTNYVTVAERADPNGMILGSAVFDRDARAWRIDQGANWRHPEGADTSIEGRDRYPVTAIAYEDAEAYARWAGRRLPTENEWELASRGEAPASANTRAEAYDANGHAVANTWQGLFPVADTGEDGFTGLAPVGCFPRNANGAYDMIGNVWEWTSDLYDAETPQDFMRSAEAPPRVLKGGSNLCASNFCSRFRSGSRQPGDPGLGMSHLGFRTAGSPT